MPIIAGTEMKVIALCMSDEGMPQTVDDRMKIADTAGERAGQKPHPGGEHLREDPLVQPVSVDNRFGVGFINAIERIVAAFPWHPHGLRAEQHLLRAAGAQVHEPDLHDHGDRQGAGRGNHQPHWTSA